MNSKLSESDTRKIEFSGLTNSPASSSDLNDELQLDDSTTLSKIIYSQTGVYGWHLLDLAG